MEPADTPADEKQCSSACEPGPACAEPGPAAPAVFPSLPGRALFEHARGLGGEAEMWGYVQAFVASRARGLGVVEPTRAAQRALHIMQRGGPTRETLALLREWRRRLEGRARAPCGAARQLRTWWPAEREAVRLRTAAWALKLAAARLGDGAYLDVGCAEGRLTAAVAGALGLPRGRAFACDVTPQAESRCFTFTRYGGRVLPFKDGAFAFVTAFMAAHHFVDAAGSFREIRRVLRPGGLLLLRELNCRGAADAIYYDLVHACYACVFSAECTPAAFAAEYRAEYRSAAGWAALAAAAGFRPVAADGANAGDPNWVGAVHLLFE